VHAANAARRWRDLEARFTEVRRLLRPEKRVVVAAEARATGRRVFEEAPSAWGSVEATSIERRLDPRSE